MRLCAALLLAMLVLPLAATPEPTEEMPENTATPEAHPGEDAARRAAGKRGTRRAPPLEEFVPSEEVSADKPVSFPTDI